MPGPSLSVPRRCRSPVGTTLRPPCGESSSRAEKVPACSMSAPLAALGASINRVTPAASSSMTLRGSGGRWMSGGDRMGLRGVDMGASVFGTLRHYPSVNRRVLLRCPGLWNRAGRARALRAHAALLSAGSEHAMPRRCTMHHGGANAQTQADRILARLHSRWDTTFGHSACGSLPPDAAGGREEEGIDGVGDQGRRRSLSRRPRRTKPGARIRPCQRSRNSKAGSGVT